MKAFVFGAGASHHVGYPLVKDLGEALAGFSAGKPQGFGRIYPHELRQYFDSLEDFEQVISDLEDPPQGSRISQEPQQKRTWLLTGIRDTLPVYFDSIRRRPAPLYQLFAEKACSGGDVVITFNYDVSVESGLRKAGKWHIGDGYGFLLGESVTPSSPVKVLKLHGSTNWLRMPAAQDAEPYRPVIRPQEFEFFEYTSDVKDPKFFGGTGSDLMILPARSKRFAAPFWGRLWERAARSLATASEIVIVGYSLPLGDGRARKTLLDCGNKSARVTICCGNNSARIAREFIHAGFTTIRADAPCFDTWLGSLA